MLRPVVFFEPKSKEECFREKARRFSLESHDCLGIMLLFIGWSIVKQH